MSKHNSPYNVKLIENAYRYLPSFNDVFDEESWYIFTACFVILTIIVFIFLSKFVTLKPVDW